MKRNYRKNKESKIKNIILENIMENARSYLILLVIFFIGIILGVIFVNNAKEAQSLQISSYINNFVESVKENYQISRSKLLMKSILNNLYITIILWFLGSTVIGFPLIYVVIGYKGYSIGYTISSIIATLGTGKGLIFIISTMLFQSIIYIPAILALSYNRLYTSLSAVIFAISNCVSMSGISTFSAIGSDSFSSGFTASFAASAHFFTRSFDLMLIPMPILTARRCINLFHFRHRTLPYVISNLILVYRINLLAKHGGRIF